MPLQAPTNKLLVITPNDTTYEEARRVWNGAVDQYPALIVRPSNVQEVIEALAMANRHGVPVAVRGAGYDWAGRSVREGALIIDLARMAHVEVNPAARTARVGGGATSAQVMVGCSTHGLVPITGAIGGVGFAGFTLGGGYGPLTPGLGLGLDTLLAAELVLANGAIVRSDAKVDSDLFWAIRGGGGNFGVVTSLTVRLHPLSEVRAGKALYPWTGAAETIVAWGERMAEAPDALAATLALIAAPDGKPAIALAPCWQGSPNEGAAAISSLLTLGTPIMAKVEPMPPASLFALFEANAVPRRRYAQQTRWLPTLTEGAVSALIGAAERRTSTLSAIALQSFHGVPTRVFADATAFPVRQRHFLVSIVAAWEEDSPEADARHAGWARDTSASLEPFALPGGYANLLGPEETAQLANVYGANLDRLRVIKRRVDPNNRFTANGPIS
jgi:FAD/FMN-containing dehydrogenase